MLLYRHLRVNVALLLLPHCALSVYSASAQPNPRAVSDQDPLLWPAAVAPPPPPGQKTQNQQHYRHAGRRRKPRDSTAPITGDDDAVLHDDVAVLHRAHPIARALQWVRENPEASTAGGAVVAAALGAAAALPFTKRPIYRVGDTAAAAAPTLTTTTGADTAQMQRATQFVGYLVAEAPAFKLCLGELMVLMATKIVRPV
jgi:hypothetical protein